MLYLRSALTPRQREIVLLVVQGLSNKAIAHQLTIEVGTVEAQLTTIYRKYAVKNRQNLIIKILRQQPSRS